MIIGFTGKMGTGKSEACKIIQEEVRDVYRVNFKDGLINEMNERLYPHLVNIATSVYGAQAKRDVPKYIDKLFNEKPPLMRSLMQCYGTEVRRSDNPNYWTETWSNTVSNIVGHVVCDDVRFLNEAEAVRKHGGVVVRIIRTDITDTGSHPSETEMNQIVPDYTITVGKGEIAKLKNELREIYESV